MSMVTVIRIMGLVGFILFCDGPALATQAHGAPEGLYAHQLAHLVFIVSMGVLIYWLRARRPVQETGWRYIQYAALFFILWNLDAFCVHLLEEQSALIEVQRLADWQMRITAAHPSGLSLKWLYYAAKLDHLLCVPAMCFLYFGLRRLMVDTQKQSRRIV